MATYASVPDVQDRWEQSIPLEGYSRVATLLDRAERVLTATVGDQVPRIAAGLVTAEDVRDVVCEMALRVLRNPGGMRSQTAGPFSATVDATVSSGRLFVSQADRRQLRLRRGATSVPLEDPALATLLLHPDRDRWPADGPLPTP